MGLMPATGANQFVAFTKQDVIGHLKATNSRDTDVLYAQKMQLIAPKKQLTLLGWICIVGGAFFTVTVILAIAGIPFMIFGWWLLRFSKRNIQTVEDAYSEYLGSGVSRAIAIALAAVLVSSVAFAQAPASRPGVVAAPPADANGFKIGDTIEISTGLGWMNATILSMNGNNYRVRSQVGIELTKTYPAEVRRIGAPTAKDRAAGIYNLHDRVQVNVQGRWETGEIMTILASDYQVRLSGNRSVWASGQALRSVAPEAAPRAAAAGTPPRPGLASCAGKIEGRYATTGGFGSMTIEFRSGKATMKSTLGEVDMVLECWTAGEKIYLHKPGEPGSQDMPIDINDDGTLQTPMGELKKKGK